MVNMMRMPPTIAINEKSAQVAWAKLVSNILNGGYRIKTEYGVDALDVCGIVTIGEKGISELLNVNVHRKDPLGRQWIIEYLKEYRRDYPMDDGFEYTYLRQFTTPIDQLRLMRDALGADESCSKLIQAITVRNVEEYWDMIAKPCLQRIWVRKVSDNDVEVHLHWRSRDAWAAFTPNLCAVMRLLREEVLKPNGLRAVKLVDVSDSYHIYDHDIEQASDLLTSGWMFQ